MLSRSVFQVYAPETRRKNITPTTADRFLLHGTRALANETKTKLEPSSLIWRMQLWLEEESLVKEELIVPQKSIEVGVEALIRPSMVARARSAEEEPVEITVAFPQGVRVRGREIGVAWMLATECMTSGTLGVRAMVVTITIVGGVVPIGDQIVVAYQMIAVVRDPVPADLDTIGGCVTHPSIGITTRREGVVVGMTPRDLPRSEAGEVD